MTERKTKPEVRGRAGFEFVTVASARAKQLLRGCVPRVEGSAKPARRALQEVAGGHVKRSDKASGE